MQQFYGPKDIVLMRRLTMSKKVETVENEPDKDYSQSLVKVG